MATAVAADMVNGSMAGRRMTDRLTESQFKSPGQETQESRKGPCQEVLATAGAEQGIPTNQSEIFVIENSGIVTTSRTKKNEKWQQPSASKPLFGMASGRLTKEIRRKCGAGKNP